MTANWRRKSSACTGPLIVWPRTTSYWGTVSASRRRETLLNFGFGGIERRAGNLVRRRRRRRRRLQLGTRILRNVGEIRRQSRRSDRRRCGQWAIIFGLGHDLVSVRRQFDSVESVVIHSALPDSME